MMNEKLYQTTKAALTQLNVPNDLADAASRIIATDDPSQPNLGRSPADTEVCMQVAQIINSQKGQPCHKSKESQVKSDRPKDGN